MRPHRTLLRFFVLLVLIYALLILPWPGVDRGYLVCVCAVGNQFFGTIAKEGTVVFDSHPTNNWLCSQTLTHRGTGKFARRLSLVRPDYLATALVVALVLATPISWRRKSIALLLGLLLIDAFVFWRLWLGLVDTFSDHQLALIRFTPFWKETVRLAVHIFIGSIEASFIVPVFVWILVTFRRGDLERLGFLAVRRDEKRIAVTSARSTKTQRLSP